jgi:hypothetical protein
MEDAVRDQGDPVATLQVRFHGLKEGLVEPMQRGLPVGVVGEIFPPVIG